MKIVEFNCNHIEQAAEIAKINYEEERLHVTALPKVETLPGLEHFADNKLGVAAFDGNRMLGFLGSYLPREDHFQTTNVRGNFSPIHAHGVIQEEMLRNISGVKSLTRDRIYSMLYQAAADKWVKAGIRSHAIALYTHDQDAFRSFYYNGFGLRCIDAIRSLSDLLTPLDTKQFLRTALQYLEVPREEWMLLLECNNGLIAHLGASPAFMRFDLLEEDEFLRRSTEHTRYFAARTDGRYIGYIKTDNFGENFATETEGMLNICGAYLEPPYRGTGVYHNLLCFLINTLKKEGYLLLGVDCESFNPTARGFWLKYFTEYTHSVVRRIDDKAFVW